MTVQEILAAARALSQEERLQVAIQLLESLKLSFIMPQKVADADPDWKVELHPLVRALVGVLPEEDQDLQDLYLDYLEEKYR